MNTTASGGQIAIRGFIVQTLVALLGVVRNQARFVSITLEPNEAHEQFDFVWFDGQQRHAVQVKSTQNEFQKPQVQEWARKLLEARQDEDCTLMLVGNYHSSLAGEEAFGAVRLQKRNLDLMMLRASAAEGIAHFLEQQSLHAGTAISRQEAVTYLEGKLLDASIVGREISRDELCGYLRSMIAQAAQTTRSIDVSRIDSYAPPFFPGREGELALLNDGWNAALQGASQRARVISFVAMGGEGKTALLATWARGLAEQGWPGVDAVFAWSFYSQGTRDYAAASSDMFLAAALGFFGLQEVAQSGLAATEKVERLAQVLAQRRVLLLLDGMEPLQYPPSKATALQGKLQDGAMALLLKKLVQQSLGLVVVTTRFAIEDLVAYAGAGARGQPAQQHATPAPAPVHPLLRLPAQAGVELLKSLKVNGSQTELAAAVEEMHGHALSLRVLGAYLHDAYGGDVRQRGQIDFANADQEEQNGHAFRVIEQYMDWFATDGERGQRARALLALMGLFDRPASGGCWQALLQAPPIAGLTDVLFTVQDQGPGQPPHYQMLAQEEVNISLTRLEKTGLLTVQRQGKQVQVVDAHPLLREYFAKTLCGQAAWQQAHQRLFDYLCASTEDKPEPTLDDLQPLYQAVGHGCLAGLQQTADAEVYWKRILRGEEAYSTDKLGAVGADLVAIACFFGKPWQQVASPFGVSEQAWLLSNAASYLRALGRLADAQEPMRAGLALHEQQQDWENAAASASNLSQLALLLGEVGQAVATGTRAVQLAEQSGDAFQRLSKRITHADALNQAGQTAAGLDLFHQAEQIQAERQPEYPLLYSLRGFLYCDALLVALERNAWQTWCQPAQQAADHENTCAAVGARAAQTLAWAEVEKLLLEIGLDHLTLGRIGLYRAVLAQADTAPCQRHLAQALTHLRRTNDLTYLPLILLTQAWLNQITHHPESAQAHLDEAWEIASRGPMPLFLADIHLHRARLFFRSPAYPWQSAQHDLQEARRLIETCGYKRRLPELEDAEAAILPNHA
jgi:tetratricopeptide (TPR) repeat protein